MSNLSLFSLVLLAAVHLTGLLALVWCATFAPEGYEDGAGFHLGREPLPRSIPGSAPAKND
jgi:hypothetical protein